jgi:glycosyltransferase involved in cell wall biosynthesis
MSNLKPHQPHRIYAVHLLNDHSGSPRVLTDAIEALHSAGFECCLLTSQHSGFLQFKHVKNYTVPYARVNNRWLLLLIYLLSQCFCFVLLSGLLLRDKLRGVRSTVLVNTLLPFGAFVAARLFANSCIGYIHETSISPKLLKAFLRWVVNCCAHKIIFVSKYLAQVEGFRKPKPCVIYNGLRSDIQFNNIDIESKFNNGMVLFCGSPKIYKGILQFVELAKRLENLRFVAALNCSEDELRSLRIAPQDNLTLLIKPSNLPELYQSAFLVVNLSVITQCVETFGLTLLEGMAAGCPVIAPPVGGPLELVDHSVGACIDSTDLPALLEYIQMLTSDYGYWASCSLAAKAKADEFSSDIYRINVVKFFSEL